MEIKFYYTFQHEETGRFCSIIFDYAQIFNGECKAQCERLTGYFVVGKRLFTGEQDETGKDIYEGDVVEEEVETEYGKEMMKHTVEFNAGAFYPICMQPSTTFKVIGNVIETPVAFLGRFLNL